MVRLLYVSLLFLAFLINSFAQDGGDEAVASDSSLGSDSLQGADPATAGLPREGPGPFFNRDFRSLRTPGNGIDFSEGTARLNGERIDPTKNRAFRSQFETYLSKDDDALEELNIYQQEIQQILEILSPLHMLENEKELYPQVEEAYKKLYDVAEYEADGGASRTLAHMIFSMWRLRHEIRQDIKKIDRNTTEVDSIYYINKGSVESKATLAVAQFEAQIGYFVLQRRYDHAIMASYFYRMLFKGSKQELPSIGSAINDLSNSLSKLGMETGTSSTTSSMGGQVYTVEFVEQFCQTIQGKIREHIESFNRTYAAGDLNTALERLQEVFIPGEYTEAVMTLPGDIRERLLLLYRKHRRLDEYASAKDYENMLQFIDQIEEMAPDFIQGAGMRSQAKSAMRMSKFKLVAAKQALSEGNYERGEALMAESVEIWPLNPGTDHFADQINERGDASLEYAARFDEWLEAGDNNSIFENREALGLALVSDREKLDQLKEVIRTYSSAAFLLGQAEDIKDSAPLLAWDLLEQVSDELSSDPKLLLLKQQLLVSALPYANLLDKAKKAEQYGKWNVAISLYIKAQSLNPMSKPAELGIQRANQALLSSIH